MKPFLILLLLFCFHIASSQQEIPVFINSLHKRPEEKIYLQFDKPYYTSGDSIWFSVYLLNADMHTPDTISRILYTELISPDNKVIMSHKLKADNGRSYGDFRLPDSLPAGNYQIRAYTNWMRNFDNDYFFKKDIPVYGLTSDSLVQSVRYEETHLPDSVLHNQNAPASKIDLRFFPEGGYLVNSLVSTIGFKAVDINGKGAPVKGFIEDEHGTGIVSFESNAAGMGSFQLRPEKGKNYYANISNRSALPSPLYPVPVAQEKGYVISVNTSPEKSIGITIQYASPGNHDSKELWLTGETRGRLYFASELSFKKDSVNYSIPKYNFPTGITKITLFEKDKPVCERLIFIDQKDFLIIRITPDKEQYTTREKTTLAIQVTDKTGNPVSASLSLAVTDAAQVMDTSRHKENILSYLLLNSELKGNIENPGQYFSDDSIIAPLDLDHLLLTQGWRRYRWDRVNSDSLPPIKYAAEQGFTISGKVATHPRSKAVTGNSLSLLFQKQTTYAAQASPLLDSTFNFDLPDFYDSAKVVIQTKNAKGKENELTFTVDDDLSPEPDHFLERKSIELTAQTIDYINTNRQNKVIMDSINEFRGKTLGEVVVTAKEIGSTYANVASMSVDIEEVESQVNFEYLSIFHLLARQIPGSRLIPSPWGGDILITWHGPLYLLNDEMINPNYLFSLDLKTVKVVKFIPRGAGVSFKYVFRDVDVIAIYTYPNGRTRRKATGISIIKLSGYYKPQEFYSPLYNTTNSAPIRPDLRSTLYWSPSIQTDSAGKANVSFYMADRTTRINTVVEGISTEGVIGRKEKLFNKQ